MTATEGRIKPQSISDDVRALEEALAAGPIPLVEWTRHQGHVCIPETTDWREIDINCNAFSNKLVGKHLAHYIAAAHPARLRRVLDTMQAMSDALDEMVSRFEPMAWGSSDNRADALRSARAALALYEGKQ